MRKDSCNLFCSQAKSEKTFLHKVLATLVIALTLVMSLSPSIGLAQSFTFNYTGAVQTWVVPAGVTSVNIQAWGAQGGNGANGSGASGGGTGGLGAKASGTLAVTPGQILNIYVGGRGITSSTIRGRSQTGPTSGGLNSGTQNTGGGASDVSVDGISAANRVIAVNDRGITSSIIERETIPFSGGFNGGGNGGAENTGGGGGASDVRVGGIAAANRVITAGGGGGGGRGGCQESEGAIPGAGGNGGVGGGGVGNSGFNSTQPSTSGNAGGGFGGNFGNVQGALGAAGIGCSGFLGQPGSATSNEIGGNGGGGQTCCCNIGNSIPGGGGGGGGQIGGGGGGGGSAGTVACLGNSKGAGGGGGGGSSYIGGVTNGNLMNGVQTGDGQVIITIPALKDKISITDPCTCLNNATTLTNGQFGETVTVNAPTGQTWTVTAVTGLYATSSPAPPLAPIPILVGATMTEGPAGVYNLTGKHIDAIGYTITVDNGLGSTQSIGNMCAYPNPVITGLAPAICANNTPITLTGTPGDANIVSQSFTINGAPATQFTPSIPGTYTIGYTVNGGVPNPVANDPGCTQTVTQTVSVITSVTGTILGNSNTTICAGQSSDINMDLSGAPNFSGVFNIAVQSGSGIPTGSFPFTATTNGASSITIPAGNLTNTSSSPVTYRVTWVSLSDLSGCPVSSLTGSATIIVYPLPTITATLVNSVGLGATFSGQINGSDPTTSLRAFRDGVVKTCAAPGTCPAGIAGTFNYDLYTWTNPTPQCVSLTFSNTAFNFSFVSAYSAPPNFANLCQNWLGDPGSSVTAGTPIDWSINAPAGTIYFLVTNVISGVTADYSIVLNSANSICPGTAIVYNVTNPNAVPGSVFNWTAKDNNGAGATLGSGSNVAFGNAAVSTTLSLACPTTHVNPIVFTFTPVGPVPLACTGTPVSSTVSVGDLVAPVLKNGAVLPANQTNVNACKAGAPASPTVADIKALYTDNCTADANLVVNQTVNTVTGDDCNWTATYTFTIKDACNNTTTVTITHTGKDLTAPTWTSLLGNLNRTVEYCDIAALNAAQTLVPVATDNCGGVVSYFKSEGVFAQTGCSHNGIITNSFIAKDPCLNTSIVFTQVITIVDNNGPTLTTNSTTGLSLDIGGPGCNSTLPNYITLLNAQAADCATPPGSVPNTPVMNPVVANYPVAGAVTLTQSPLAGTSVFGPGGTILPVTITATDVCGKITTRTFNVNIVDATAPIARCHIDTLTLGTNGTAFILPSFIDGNANNVAGLGNKFPLPRTLSSDNCTPVILKFNVAGNLRDTVFFNCGSVNSGQQATLNTVVLRSTDVAGNFSECTATVRVIENTPPVFTTCPTTTLTANKDASCTYVMEDMRVKFPNQFIAKDSCGPSNAQNGITYTQSPAVGSIIGGLTSIPVTITATDTHTNTATCTFTLVLNDVTAPVFTCPNQNQNLLAAANSCSAVSNTWTIPTATDACSPSNGLGPITYSVAVTGNTTLPVVTMTTTQATFYVGVTTVTYTARDQAGNTSACSFTVTVNDNVRPVVTVPAIICAAVPSVGTNNVIQVTRNVTAGTCGWVNANTLNPTVNAIADASATDNCLMSTLTYRLTPATNTAGVITQTALQNATSSTISTGTTLANFAFPVGTTKVAWIATDFSTNRDSCTFFVTVTDNIAPTFTCPANVTFAVNAANCSANVPASLTSATNITDNCAVTLQEWDVSFPVTIPATPPASGTGQLPNNFNFPSGTSTVQYRIRDAANNIAVCTFTVTIGSGVTGTIGSDATVGQNIATTSTIVFTGAGSAAPAGTQVYTFNYSLSVNGGGFVQQPLLSTAAGSNVITVAQPNAVLGTFAYRLNSVTDGNACPGVVVGQNTATINIVVGNPSLAISLDLAPSQINAGGAIEEAIVLRNIGTAPTAGTITVNATVYSALTGLTVAQSLANATINGTPYTPTPGWNFNAATGDFTSSAVIPAGGNSTIRIRITRGTGLLAGSASQVNHTVTVSGGGEPAQQANDGSNTTNTVITKN